MKTFDEYKEETLGRLRIMKEHIEADMRDIEKAETTREIAEIALRGLDHLYVTY